MVSDGSSMDRFDAVAEVRRLMAMSTEERARHTAALEARRVAEERRRKEFEEHHGFNAKWPLPDDMRGWRYDAFQPLASQAAAWQLVRVWAHEAVGNLKIGRGLALVAPPGRGKTSMLAALHNGITALAGRPVTVAYVDWSDIVFRSKSSTFAATTVRDELAAAELLVWDDLGVNRDTKTTIELARSLIRLRLQRRRPTLYALPAWGSATDVYGDLGGSALYRLRQSVPPAYFCAWEGLAVFDGAETVDEYVTAAGRPQQRP